MPNSEIETVIQQIVSEITNAPKRSLRNRLLRDWREKLEYQPPHFDLPQVDEIIFEVRKRLKTNGSLP